MEGLWFIVGMIVGTAVFYAGFAIGSGLKTKEWDEHEYE